MDRFRTDSMEFLMSDQPIRQRKWRLRFGLKSIAILMAACSVVAVLMGSPVADAYLEQRIWRVIVGELGGRVAKGITDDRSLTYKLAKRIGKERSLERILSVDFRFSPIGIDDDDLQWVRHLRELREIRLAGTGITDAGIPHLVRAPQLETVDISSTSVTDAGFQRLTSSASVKSVRTTGTPISFAALHQFSPSLALARVGSELSGASRTQGRPMSHSQVGSNFFLYGRSPDQIHWLTSIKYLQQVTDERCRLFVHLTPPIGNDLLLRKLSRLPCLSSLHASSSQISDIGVRDLATIQNLVDLRLFNANLTPGCWEDLVQLPNLTVLELPSAVRPKDEESMRARFQSLERLRFF